MLDSITKHFSAITKRFSGKHKITEGNIRESLDEIQVAMLDADVNLRVVRRFINKAREEVLGEKVLRSVEPGQQFIKVIYDRMVDLLGGESETLSLKGTDTISSILMLGLQGAGKTTTTAKLAYKLKSEGRKILLVGCDLQRPAAVEQLSILASEAGVGFFSDQTQKSPVLVARKALQFARKESYNTVLLDTAGRLHIDEALIRELREIKDEINPAETVFVADAMTGQGAASVAQNFAEQIGIDSVILTKFDSETRGGAALSIKSVAKKPIKFIGVGEKLGDLDRFYPDRIASRILGMGDVISLVEKAEALADQEESAKLERKIRNKEFNLQDLLGQIREMKKLGSVDKVLEMLPNMAGKMDQVKERFSDRDLRHKEAIILSMTPQERANYRIIGLSRRRRIAAGAGVQITAVSRLLKEFEKNRNMMRKMLKNKGMQVNAMKRMGF